MSEILSGYDSMITNSIITGYGIMHQYIERRERYSASPVMANRCYDYLDKIFCTRISQECPVLNVSAKTVTFIKDVTFHKADTVSTEYEVEWTETNETIGLVKFVKENLIGITNAVFEDAYVPALLNHLENGDETQQLFSILTIMRNIYSRFIFNWMMDVYDNIPIDMQMDLREDGIYHALSCMINLWWDFLTNVDPIITIDPGSHLLPPNTPKSSFIGKIFIHPIIAIQRSPVSPYGFILSIRPSKLRVRC